MFRTEIVIGDVTHRVVRGSLDKAVAFAREIADEYGIESTGTVDELREALLDSDETSGVDIALPVVSADCSTCPQCDVMGGYAEGDTSSWCEACGYDSEEA